MALSTEDFIARSKAVHGNKFDYSKSKYVRAKDRIIVICKTCGYEAAVIPHNHMNGRGCKSCQYITLPQNKPISHESFVKRARNIHSNKFEYLSEYKSFKKPITIKCQCGYAFKQKAGSHLEGRGCKRCGDKASRQKQLLSIREFETRSLKVHNNTYAYIGDYDGYDKKVSVICSQHGLFRQEANAHLRGQGCPKCDASKGEVKIEIFLKNHNISYISEKRFTDCRGSKYPLAFDFYIPDRNLIIEYDGYQHFYPVAAFGGKRYLARIKEHDRIKNEYCDSKKIIMLRIPFFEFENIESILRRILC